MTISVRGGHGPLLRLLRGAILVGVAVCTRVWYSVGSGNLDQGIYLAVSERLLQGGVLYVNVPESKPPGFYALNLITTLAINHNLYLAPVCMGIVCGISAALIAESSALVWEREAAGVASGLIFALLSSFPVFEAYTVLTEPYMVLCASVALLLLSLLVRGKLAAGWISLLFLGFALGSIPWVRQSGAIGDVVLIGLSVVLLKEQLRKLPAALGFLAGLLLPSASVLALYAAIGHLHALLSNTILTPVAFQQGAGLVPYSLRLSYFQPVEVALLPLVVLLVSGVCPVLERRSTVTLGIFAAGVVWSFEVIYFNLYTHLTGGYPHEYLEILLPLSLIGGASLLWIIDSILQFAKSETSYKRTDSSGVHPKWRLAGTIPRVPPFVSIPLVLLLLYFSTTATISYAHEAISLQGSTQVALVDQLSNFIREYTPRGNSTYVFETAWPAISLEVYYTADRFPPIPDMFYFPPDISHSQALGLIASLEKQRTEVVVIIGGKPPFPGAQLIYDYIQLNYHAVRSFGTQPTCVCLPPEPIVGYLRDNSTKYVGASLDFYASAPATGVNLSTIGSNSTNATFAFEMTGGTWFTLFFTGFPCDYAGNYSLRITWQSNPMPSQIAVDFVTNHTAYTRDLLTPWSNTTLLGYLPTAPCILANSDWSSINLSYEGYLGAQGNGSVEVSLVRNGDL